MKHEAYLNWIVGLIVITLIICGTIIWINYNSWTIRFEMDYNTRMAIESIEFEEINQKCVETDEIGCWDIRCWDMSKEDMELRKSIWMRINNISEEPSSKQSKEAEQ